MESKVVPASIPPEWHDWLREHESRSPVTGEIYVWFDDAVWRFGAWLDKHERRDAPTVALAWADCAKRARQKVARARRVQVDCPTCHGKGTVLRAPR